jgi:predicted HD phosphohydrolase
VAEFVGTDVRKEIAMDTVAFRQMKESTQADYDLLESLRVGYLNELPDRIVDSLKALDRGKSGYQISRLQHSLQTATRAERDGADIELIVAAVIHDIGDELAPENHSQLAGAMIRPYVRPEVTWIVNTHGVFQLKYFGQWVGADPDSREIYRGHRWFDACERFCEQWDQTSFDPGYPTEPLEHFVPMLRQVFLRDAFDPRYVGDQRLAVTEL